VLREIRQVVDKYPGNPVLISEAFEPNVAELTRMYGEHGDEVQLPMDFQVADVDKLSAPEFRKLLDEIESNPVGGQPYFFFSNHDQVRQWDRYGDGVHNDQIAKLMATLLLTARGTPQMYYGEEIGMRTTPPTRKEDVKDPIGKTGWPKEKGRDGERTPMQWDGSKNAGFSTADQTWLPVPPDEVRRNVSAESRNSDSILNFYKRVIALRRSEPALRDGSYVAVNRDDKHVLSFVRKNPGAGDSVLVALNMSAEVRTLRFDLAGQGVMGGSGRLLVSLAGQQSPVSLASVTLPPFGVLIAAVK
jgi:alpha-glucosidase